MARFAVALCLMAGGASLAGATPGGASLTVLEGNYLIRGQESAFHNSFLVDDYVKQDFYTTFTDKAKCLTNILGLKVADYAYNLTALHNVIGPNDVFDGEPPHKYKRAYYKAVLAESLAYNIPSSLVKVPFTNVGPEGGIGCRSAHELKPGEQPYCWYAQTDVILAELICAVQAIGATTAGAVFSKSAAGQKINALNLGALAGAALAQKRTSGVPYVYKSAAEATVSPEQVKQEMVQAEHEESAVIAREAVSPLANAEMAAQLRPIRVRVRRLEDKIADHEATIAAMQAAMAEMAEKLAKA